MKKCPYCAEEIQDEAIKCKHCGADIHQPIKSFKSFGKASRKCLACGYTGEMKTWLANYNLPQFITLILLFSFIIPGLIFIAWGWGKYKCPKCGVLAKNVQI